jgi:hypothetical protein
MTGSPPATATCANRSPGSPASAYGISHLRGDLQRFAFLLGAGNSAQLFGDQY